MYIIFYIITLISLLYTVLSAPQATDTRLLGITDPITEFSNVNNETINQEMTIVKKNNTTATQKEEYNVDNSFSVKIYKCFAEPMVKIFKIPKVKAVLRNIGTCMVNGAMELVSYYLPPAFMPLIATAAGLIIPFEPVVMLKERMPVTSYRRALNTAMNSFLRTFDQYKVEDEYDPYMTQQFNRRFMNDHPNKNAV